MTWARMRLLAAAAIATALIATPAWAAFRPRVSATPSGTLMVNRRAAVRFQTRNGALGPAERASVTAQRLSQLVNQGASPYLIFAKGTRKQARVYAGETLVCVVTRLDAKKYQTSALALAGAWAANIRSLLLLPPIVLSDRQLVVPLGENRRVFVTGAAVGPIYTKSDKGEVATSAPGADGRYIQVTGQDVGSATVAVTVEGETETIQVSVKRYAGSAPATSFAEVTGNPCPGALIEYVASQAVLRGAQLEPGAGIKIEQIEGAKSGLGMGLTRDVKVSVAITGLGYLDYRATPTVEVHDSDMPREQVQQLFYSNNPERIVKYQTLFAGKLEPDKSTRVLYHHQNGMGKRAHFLIELVNPTDSPAAFRVFRGVSAPLVDTVLVGYVASNAFLRDQYSNSSVIERVPPQSRLILISDMLNHLDTTSGILQIRQTDGKGASVRVAALPPGLDDVKMGQIASAPTIVDMLYSDHIYPMPTQTVEAGYVVGQRWAFISIGRKAIDSHNSQLKLDGNYGVTYVINVKVENPTDQEKKICVLFEPSAGLASGVFIIDGTFVSTKYAQPPAEFPLASYKLKPGQVRNMRIETLPVAGSNYPATLVVRS